MSDFSLERATGGVRDPRRWWKISSRPKTLWAVNLLWANPKQPFPPQKAPDNKAEDFGFRDGANVRETVKTLGGAAMESSRQPPDKNKANKAFGDRH